jgi:hypothetical protein
VQEAAGTSSNESEKKLNSASQDEKQISNDS